MTRCGYPGCDYEDESRPYARKRKYGPSVTTVIDFANTDQKFRAMNWAAAEIAATTAIHGNFNDGYLCSRDHKIDPGLCPACQFCRTEFDRRWRDKATLGGHVHHLAKQWAAGEDIKTDPVSDPYIDGLAAFYDKYKPSWAYIEQTIYYNHDGLRYVGSFDAIATLSCPVCPNDEKHRWLLDIKTGSHHALEWALQLSAYRWATDLTNWQVTPGDQWIVSTMPKVEHTGVIWLKDTGECDLVWVPSSTETHKTFLDLLRAYEGIKVIKKEVEACSAQTQSEN